MFNLLTQLSVHLFNLGGARPGFPADVAPPVPYLIGGAAVVLLVIGVIVLLIVLISIRVLRRIKQENAPDQEE